MKLQAFIRIDTRNEKGEIVDSEEHEAHSFVRGYIDTLQIQASQVTVANGWTDTGGTQRNTAISTSNFSMLGAAGVITSGIVVGTGNGAVTVSDIALGTQIQHGAAASKLMYGVTSVGIPATVGSARQFTVARTFTNSSGGDITVNEVGIYALGNANSICIDRTLLTFTITNGTSKTVTYTIKVTV